ncbi:MAG: hypothetical protein KBD21_01740 [Candidatus Pacebacteria bacterium]|nr:hypothetical protein [Candidatus Paceibacterota bacterium]
MRKDTTEKVRTIVLLDTHAILHRAFHALPDLATPSGQPTGALYGLASFILKIGDDLAPDHIIAAFDLPEPTHRHEAFESYKATRQKTDDALVAQIVRSRDILDAFGIPWLEAVGFEADDILGTLARTLSSMEGVRVVIASGDMDTLQLVEGDTVVVYTLKKGLSETIIYTEEKVIERYGFPPALVPDYKGLRGDPSDNIPGIRGIGEKTATTLVSQFGSLDSIYDTLAAEPERVRAAGITERIMGLLLQGEDDARFSKELATIRRDVPVAIPALTTLWPQCINRHAALDLFTELGFRSLANRLREKLGIVPEQPQREEAPPSESEVLEATLALWLVRSDSTNPSLEDVFEYTGTHSFRDARAKVLHALHEQKLERVLYDIELPVAPVIRKMEERGILLDVEYLKKLSSRYHSDLDELAARIYAQAGIEFNLNSPRQLGEVLFDRMGIGGGKGKKTATGQRSTREDELKKYTKDEPIIADILEYRELQKLLSTYIDNLPVMTDAGHRLHAHFSQSGTTTGRMSSQSPNMQNIPIKSTRGSAIRRAILAPEGFLLVCADYSQIELRIASFLSGDEKLIESFRTGSDIHTAVAAQVFDVPLEQVDKEMRRRAKAINFGILYGMGANALAEATGTGRKEAQMYLDEYFKRFSGIHEYMERIKADVHMRGYTETWFGRRRYFEGARSPLPYVVAAAERMALNAPIQGTQADIIKMAMIRIDAELAKHTLTDAVFLNCQIHDELMFEVRTDAVASVVPLIRTTMESVMRLEDTKGVPLKVDVEVGPNWGELSIVVS